MSLAVSSLITRRNAIKCLGAGAIAVTAPLAANAVQGVPRTKRRRRKNLSTDLRKLHAAWLAQLPITMDAARAFCEANRAARAELFWYASPAPIAAVETIFERHNETALATAADREWNRLWEIEAAIAAAPAKNVTGLAIKLAVWVYNASPHRDDATSGERAALAAYADLVRMTGGRDFAAEASGVIAAA